MAVEGSAALIRLPERASAGNESHSGGVPRIATGSGVEELNGSRAVVVVGYSRDTTVKTVASQMIDDIDVHVDFDVGEAQVFGLGAHGASYRRLKDKYITADIYNNVNIIYTDTDEKVPSHNAVSRHVYGCFW